MFSKVDKERIKRHTYVENSIVLSIRLLNTITIKL